MLLYNFIILVFVNCVLAIALPRDKTQLSDEDHYEGGTHNPDYDHEAFLGPDRAVEFDKMELNEKLRRLGIIFGRIDGDVSGFVSEDELVVWIKYTQNRYIDEDTNRQWGSQDIDENGKISWSEYKNATYGFLTPEDLEGEDEEDVFSYKRMIERDQLRWQHADLDEDSNLDKEEFKYFIHPEEGQHMREIVIEETIFDVDKNGDGLISLEEYIGDMYDGKGEEPSWVMTEREQFTMFRDKNQDGKMDREEVEDWVMPRDFDHAVAEAKHLIYEADRDEDGFLTKQEVLDHYDIFVGSQVTDWGEALVRHDEF